MAPGGQATLVALVRNVSDRVDSFDIDIKGLPEEWWSAPPSVNLVPHDARGGTSEHDVMVSLHPPRIWRATAGAWELIVAVHSQVEGREVATASALLHIEPFAMWEMSVPHGHVRGQQSGEFILEFRNLGNAPAALRLSGHDDSGEADVELTPARLDVAPGRDTRARAKVTAGRPILDEVRERRITLRAEGEGQRAEAPVTFTQAPLSTSRQRGLLGVVLALLASALVILGSAFADWTDTGRNGTCLGEGSCVGWAPAFELKLAGPPLLAQDPEAPDDGAPVIVNPTDGTDLDGLFGVAIPTLVAGVVVLLGLWNPRAAWIAGLFAVGWTVAYMVALTALTTGEGVGAGPWIVLIGGVLAVVAGALGSMRTTS